MFLQIIYNVTVRVKNPSFTSLFLNSKYFRITNSFRICYKVIYLMKTLEVTWKHYKYFMNKTNNTPSPCGSPACRRSDTWQDRAQLQHHPRSNCHFSDVETETVESPMLTRYLDSRTGSCHGPSKQRHCS